ncbi:MAG: hypothetical protein AAB588_04125 [Patescibacteria group bacterium]
MHRTTRSIIIASVGIALLIISLAGYFMYKISSSDFNPRPFKQADWLQASAHERGEMAHDLLKNKLLLGLGKEQVLTLLGKPDKQTPNTWKYYLKWMRTDKGLMFPNENWLLIKLSKQNKVTDALIVSYD